MKRSLLIAGGSSGIGAAVAEAAAAENWNVFIGYHHGLDRARELANKINSSNGSAWEVPLILSAEPDFNHAVNVIEEKTGSLDALILSASPAPKLASFLKMESCDLKEQLEVNVIANQKLIAECWRRFFRSHKRGHVIGILSAAALRPPWTHMTSYVTAKRALMAILECAKAELGPAGLRVSAISPDYTETPMLLNVHPLILEKARESRFEGKLLRAVDVAAGIVNLLNSTEDRESANFEEKIIMSQSIKS